MLENYFPILLFILVGLAVGVVPMALGWLFAPNRPDSEKLSPYECGFEAFEDAMNSSATREAPPINPPSMSGMPNSSAALFALTPNPLYVPEHTVAVEKGRTLFSKNF